MISIESKRLLNGILILTSSETLARIVAFVGTAYLTRILGADGFGVIGFALAFSSYFFMPINVSMSNIGSSEIARYPEQFEDYATSVIFIKLCLAIVVFSIVTLIVVLLDKPDIVKRVTLFSCLSFFSLSFDSSWAYKGLERNAPAGMALIFGQVLYVGAVIMVVKGIGDIKLVPLCLVLGEMVTALLLARLLFRNKKTRVNLKPGFILLRSAVPLIGTRLLRTVIVTSDVLILSFMLTDKDVGLYTAAYRFCFFLVAILSSIHISYLPIFSRSYYLKSKKKEAKLTEIANHAQELCAVICAPLVVGGCIFAESILSILFGNIYSEAAVALQLLIVSTGFSFFSGIAHNVLLVYDLLKIEMWIVAFAAGLNITLNLILIPNYGIAGAAFSTALVDALILFCSLIVVAKLKVKFKLTPLIKPFFAAGMMGLSLVYFVATTNLILNITFGAILYILVLMVIRGLPSDVKNYFHAPSTKNERLPAKKRRK